MMVCTMTNKMSYDGSTMNNKMSEDGSTMTNKS